MKGFRAADFSCFGWVTCGSLVAMIEVGHFCRLLAATGCVLEAGDPGALVGTWPRWPPKNIWTASPSPTVGGSDFLHFGRKRVASATVQWAR